jgi:hypothetical protein
MYNFPKLTEKEEAFIDNWRFAYRVFVEDRLGKWEWEFTQMFGEEESESEDSTSDNGEGKYSCLDRVPHFFRPLSSSSFFFYGVGHFYELCEKCSDFSIFLEQSMFFVTLARLQSYNPDHPLFHCANSVLI